MTSSTWAAWCLLQAALWGAGGVDVYDDPLPEGALSRLGTVRFSHASQADFMGDGKTLVWIDQADQSVRFCGYPGGRLVRSVPCEGVLCLSPGGLRALRQGSSRLEVVSLSRRAAPPVLLDTTILVGQEDEMGRPAGVRQAVFSGDGSLVAGGCGDGLVVLWQAETGKMWSSFHVAEAPVEHLAFSGDGSLLCAGDYYGGVALYDCKRKKITACLDEVLIASRGVGFSPDGKHVWAAGKAMGETREEWALHVFDIAGGRQVRTFGGHKNGPEAIAYLPGGRLITSDWYDGIRVWDAVTGEKVGQFRLPNRSAHRGRVSSDNRTMLIEDSGGHLTLWDPRTLKRLPGPVACAGRAVFLPGGATAAAGNRLWEVRTGRELLSFEGEGEALFVSPDGRKVIGEDGGRKVIVWDARTGRRLHEFDKHGRGPMAMNASGTRLASLHCLWDLERGKVLRGVEGEHDVFQPAAVAFGTDGTLYELFRDQLTEKKDPLEPRGRTSPSTGGTDIRAFSPDASRLACVTNDWSEPQRQFVRIVSIPLHEEQMRLTWSGKERLRIGALAFSGDGKRLAAAQTLEEPILTSKPRPKQGYVISVWNLQTRKIIREIRGFNTRYEGLSLNSDGRLLAAQGDGEVVIWKLE